MPFALIFARRFRACPPPLVATGQLTASTIIMIPVVLIAIGPAGLFSASPPVWAAVLALALLSTAFAYILYFNLVAVSRRHQRFAGHADRAGQRHSARRLFLGERLELFEIVGMALIAFGLVPSTATLMLPHWTRKGTI